MNSVWVHADTIVAGSDSTVHVSTNGGATWTPSTPVASGVTTVSAALAWNGRLYAGTFGQGVFTSSDLGDTWSPFNQGLTGGIFNSHLFIADLLVQGDSLYAATAGAGVYVRNLVAGSWTHFGEQFEPNQASNTNDIAAGGSRLLVSAGANGAVFYRDPGDADWTLSWLDNKGIVAGLAALSAIWSGNGWIVGSNIGVYRSTLGEEPWTFVDLEHGTLLAVGLASRGREVYAAFGTGNQTHIERSVDDGASWQLLESQVGVAVFGLAIHANDLYAARLDGLWRRSIITATSPTTWGAVRSKYR